jgi:hypothetical protein
MKDKELHQQHRRLMVLNEPVSRVIPKMAIPTIIAFLINSIYSLADTYFVSGLAWHLPEWVVHRKSDGLGRGEVSHFPDSERFCVRRGGKSFDIFMGI